MNVNQISNTSMANVIGQYQSCSKTQTDKNSKTNSKTYVDEIAQEKVSNTSSLGKTIGNPKLSDKALEYYNKLKEKFHNMDFILVSEDQKQAAQARAASYGNASKMVVLIDEEKLERMATDASYRDKYEGIIGNAAANLTQVSNKLSSTGSNIAGFGMQVNDNGTTSYFAVLKKSSEAQAKRIEKTKEKHVEEKRKEKKRIEENQKEERAIEKQNQKKAEKEETVTIKADTMEELIEKVRDQYQIWQTDMVMTKEERAIGQNIDFAG
ncbi:MAG: hypothetical protein II169_07260 [Lachnospiraceae bacterium]|nr:hypothetical protein [Lachnospiraceae bacterium]